MSILIKGMEMPKSCYDCRFHEVYSYKDGENRVCELSWEVLFGDEWGKNFKHPDCPLIEVPKHGRLIDADALHEHMVKVHNEWKEHPKLHESIVPVVDDEVMVLYFPTIIPAERGE